MRNAPILPRHLTPLSARQRECLVMYGGGHTYADIAEELELAWNTVRNHLARARAVLGCRRTTDAYRRMVQMEGRGG